MPALSTAALYSWGASNFAGRRASTSAHGRVVSQFMTTVRQLIVHLSSFDPMLPVAFRLDTLLPQICWCEPDEHLTGKHCPALSHRASLSACDIATVWDGDSRTVSVEISARMVLQGDNKRRAALSEAATALTVETLTSHGPLHLPTNGRAIPFADES